MHTKPETLVIIKEMYKQSLKQTMTNGFMGVCVHSLVCIFHKSVYSKNGSAHKCCKSIQIFGLTKVFYFSPI